MNRKYCIYLERKEKPFMLNNESFERWCQQLKLSEEACAIITHIRTSPPSRRVQGRAGNVSGQYPSRKMGFGIQFESRHNELAAITLMEHDPTVLEYYDQPERIRLTYQGPQKRVSVWHTPDFFVLRQDGAGWMECKMEDALNRFAEVHSQRYVRADDGTWTCPPGVAYAQTVGLSYWLRSSRETNQVYFENLRFLEEYVIGPPPMVPPETVTAIHSLVMRQPGMSLRDLLGCLGKASADDVYVLLITDQLYIDLHHFDLTKPERALVFLDQEVAQAYSFMTTPTVEIPPPPLILSVQPGSVLWWDGNAFTLLNLGEREAVLLTEEEHLMSLPRSEFERLWNQGIMTAVAQPAEAGRQAAAKARLEQAKPQHLEVATQRYTALAAYKLGHMPPDVSRRSIQRWQRQYREGEATYGNGYLGLLPEWSACGNRLPRLDQEVEELLEHFIATTYETFKQQPMREVYLLFERTVRDKHLPVPSYTTFQQRIAERSSADATRKRYGPRAAAASEWYWEIEPTTPAHGTRPWGVAHIDHTQLDIELVSARTGRCLGRPWATFLMDAFTRRLLVVYVTFDPPSYRSAMMVLRECVWRYGRLPQTIVVDGGPDFRSTYFETLVTYYHCTKATRPWARPHYGSVCERLFRTSNSEFTHNLVGNTQVMKHVRQVTRSMQPKEHAAWTLGDLYTFLCVWAYEVYDQDIHTTLGMSPREAWVTGLTLSGERTHLTKLYGDEFRYLSLPTTQKGTAKVEPGRGVKINYLYYFSKAFDAKKVQGTQVLVRYDPFNIGLAYAYVQGRWVKCLSQYHLQLRGHTERELQLASAEVRKRYQNHRGEVAITARRLADLLAKASDHEIVLLQRLQDLEARDVVARMHGSHLALAPEEQPNVTAEAFGIPVPDNQQQDPVSPDAEVLDLDEEELDEYEEYR
jgi:transposase InsO family protein